MIKSQDLADLVAAIDSQSLSLIDVREVDEYQAGHVPGAQSLPLSELAERYTELDKSRPYHLICHSGARSARACQFLAGQGYDVTNVEGGTIAWTGDLE
ncbi:rhodanese-like domain-containing protein [Streptococcus pluranimalium]|uniref:Putative adenylyltransferase/sulfurtransferase MoeZ n=1 Tax=Streptococcus pluranimalium TaxID=82348 RepID=A0A345VK04_9STRE|nr:rhodanese-like domain-containing protein [Streptococcus pluranimalium]AXJ13056.1 putative adenylyltransferase/sulfurtransferase MoeZ [Streptococcus pluranimalium]